MLNKPGKIKHWSKYTAHYLKKFSEDASKDLQIIRARQRLPIDEGVSTVDISQNLCDGAQPEAWAKLYTCV